MKQYPVRFEGKTVTLRLHSNLDTIISMVLDSLIEKTLTVYKELDENDENGLLSLYNHGQYIFGTTKDKEGNLFLDFCTEEDYKKGKVDSSFNEFIKKNHDIQPFMQECSSYPVTGRKYPWDSD